jgi:hypothetical protein
MKSSVLGLLLLSILALSAGCQRMHTETSGGGQAKISPTYEEQYVNTDPNQPGDLASQRVAPQ